MDFKKWFLSLLLCHQPLFAADMLSSWANPSAKEAVTKFVNQVTTATDPVFLPSQNRIAVFSQFTCKQDRDSFAAMQDLITYLKEAGFTVYVIVGNGTDSVQVLSEKDFGVDKVNPEILVDKNDTERLKQPTNKVVAADIKNSHPISTLTIDKLIGGQPILAIGNYDADLSMLKFTATNRPSLLMVVKRSGANGNKLIQAASQNGWLILKKQDFRPSHLECDEISMSLRGAHRGSNPGFGVNTTLSGLLRYFRNDDVLKRSLLEAMPLSG